MYRYSLGIGRVPCIFASDKRKTRRSPVIDPKLCCGGRWWFRSGFAAGSLAFLDIFILLGCVSVVCIFWYYLLIYSDYSTAAVFISVLLGLLYSSLCSVLLCSVCFVDAVLTQPIRARPADPRTNEGRLYLGCLTKGRPCHPPSFRNVQPRTP